VQTMKNGGLAPYILVSFLIHAGVLFGAHQFLKLPTEELESTELIPVEVVVMREGSPAFEPELAPGERLGPKKALPVKSQIITKTTAGPSADTIAKPLPKAVGGDPSVTIAGMPTTGFMAEPLAGEGTDSKPMLLASQISPARVSPLSPSRPAESARLEVKLPTVLIEAKAPAIPTHPRSPQMVETPLTSRLRREDPAVEHRPAPRESTYEPVLMASILQLSSHPSGAQVYVDDLLSGVTPLDMELPLGKHEVRLLLPKYYDWKAQIELTEKNKTLPIFFRLLPVE
jgi:hypothetical protein